MNLKSSKRIIPFSVSEDEMHKLFLLWAKSGKVTPFDLFEKIKIVSTKRKYVPFYLFSGSKEFNFSASVGYDREETYTEWVDKWENGKSRKVPETKTRIVTDWRPYNGEAASNVSGIGIATDYFAGYRMQYDVRFTSKTIDNNEFLPNQLPGVLIDWLNRALPCSLKYRDEMAADAEPIKAGKTVDEAYRGAADTINQQLNNAARNATPGDRVKIQHISVTWSDVSAEEVLFPVWEVVYEYEGDKYYVIIDGYETGFAAGIRPFDNGIQKNVRYSRGITMLLSAQMLIFGMIFYTADNDLIWALIMAVAGVGIFAFCLAAKRIFIKICTRKSKRKLEQSYAIFLKNPRLLFTKFSRLSNDYVFRKRVYETTKSVDIIQKFNDWCAGFDKSAAGKVDARGNKLVTVKAAILAGLSAFGIILAVIIIIVLLVSLLG